MEDSCSGYPTYPTDLSDSHWAVIRPLIPGSRPIGADRMTSMRAVVNAVLYHERSGCPWRMLPHDFPHWRTVYGYFRRWKDDGTWQRIKESLRASAVRNAPEAAGDSTAGVPHPPWIGTRRLQTRAGFRENFRAADRSLQVPWPPKTPAERTLADPQVTRQRYAARRVR
jgi:transposase